MDFFSDYETYHLKLVDTMKSILYQKDNSVFEKLDFYDDNIFSEPFLFACVNNNYEDWIDLLTFSLCKEKSNCSPIQTGVLNSNKVYLPNIGYLKIKSNDRQVFLSYENNNVSIRNNSNAIIPFEHLAPVKNKEGIEFLICNHPLLEPLFIDEKGNITEVIINEELYNKHIQHFNNALKIIENTYPNYHQLIITYIKKVVFYKGNANSFATIQAHGMAFFNVKDDHNEIFFIDNIMHQCAHVFFNALTLDKKSLFKIPYNSDLSIFTEDVSDKGYILYDRFHGLFTQTNINTCLETCIVQKLYKGDEHLELVGRFVSNMKRFNAALNKFNKLEKYNIQGLNWFKFFESTYKRIYTSNKELINKYDLSNQPYVFDYQEFKKINRHLI